jgi:hypothetical protein
MQPLKSRNGPTSPIEADAIALLRSIERYQPPPGQKQRVRVKILERSAATRRIPLIRPVLIAGLILIAAGASASLAGRLIKRPAATKPASALAQEQAAVGAKTNRAHNFNAVPVDVPGRALSASENQESQASDSASRAADGTVYAETSARADAPARAFQSSEKVLVFDAMRALRRERNPEQAAKLLNEYLRRYPHGSLAEEALALSIEAATALEDPKAKALADRYLTLYPTGRFRAAAERARARFDQ